MSTIIDKSIDTISIMIEKNIAWKLHQLLVLKTIVKFYCSKDSSDSKAVTVVEELSNNMNKYFRDYIKKQFRNRKNIFNRFIVVKYNFR